MTKPDRPLTTAMSKSNVTGKMDDMKSHSYKGRNESIVLKISEIVALIYARSMLRIADGHMNRDLVIDFLIILKDYF